MEGAATATGALRAPLRDALGELESQLLALARQRSAGTLAGARRQLARCLALGGFAQPAAAERLRRLAVLCQPLIAGTGSEDPRLLQFALRLIHDLQPETPVLGLCTHLLGRVRRRLAALLERSAHGGEPAALVGELARLASFCRVPLAVDPATPLAAPGEPESLGLLRWQERLERALRDERNGAHDPHGLRPFLWGRLDTALKHCRDSDWSLAWFCTSGLGQALHEAARLACFCASPRERAALDTLEFDLMEAHLRGEAPAPPWIQETLSACFRVLLGKEGAAHAAPVPASGCGEAAVQDALVAELAAGRAALAALLAEEGELPAAPLRHVLYKLGWLAAAAGERGIALAASAASQLLAHCWFLRLESPACLPHLLRGLVEGSAAGLLPELVRLWPRADRTGLAVALTAPHEETGAVVTLAAVPALLAASFAHLVGLRRAELDAPDFLARTAAALRSELALLERGAAAVKVWPLEQLCTVLLEVYVACERGAPLPVELLWRAHLHLVRMLDAAAAWQEAQADPALLADLEAWFEGHAEVREPSLAPDEFGGMVRLHQRLLAYARTLGELMEKPVRLHLEARTGQLRQPTLDALEAALRPLLKCILLDHAGALWTRRAVHRPRISTASITLHLQSATLRITVDEDSLAPPLPGEQLRHLERRMPGAVQLACEARAGHGRRFTFSLPLGELR